MNLLRVLYLVVKFVFDLELMARLGEVPCLALSQARSKKSRFLVRVLFGRKRLKLHFCCSNCAPLVVAVLLHVLTRAMGPMHVH